MTNEEQYIQDKLLEGFVIELTPEQEEYLIRAEYVDTE